MHRTFDGRKVKHYIGPVRIPWIIWATWSTPKSETIETGEWLKRKDQLSEAWAEALKEKLAETAHDKGPKRYRGDL